MASAELISQTDRAYIRHTGRDPDQVLVQFKYLLAGKTPSPIVRPAAVHDGIRRVQDYEPALLRRLHDEACASGRVSSFVPASGSGTRLFSSLLHLHRERETDIDHVKWRAERGDAVARDALIVLENITRFALWPSLAQHGCAPRSLEHILRTLFGDGGLRYHEFPKGLIPFHLYPEGVRTAVAEHLNESAAVTVAGQKTCHVHFTISEAHSQLFQRELTQETARLERALGVRFHVDLSVQSPATDTIAIDHDGNIRRDASGHIVFHPGGHGALLDNLAKSDGDVVFIKNIDNVARQDVLPKIAEVRQQLAGILLHVEKHIHEVVRRLRRGDGLQDAIELLDREFGVKADTGRRDDETRQQALSQLNRPLRVCGVVSTLDHAGGRPFWLETAGRGASLQIVEGAEVDLENPRDRKLFHQSRHFNPVDIVCSIRDADGQSFELSAFVVPERALIAKKVLSGVPSLLYEQPGLWNGAMGLWNTVFVEIPDFAFNPVKSISDLWAPGHRG